MFYDIFYDTQIKPLIIQAFYPHIGGFDPRLSLQKVPPKALAFGGYLM